MNVLAFRDHEFLGHTQSLCPECLQLVPAKIIARHGRVYFRKRCPSHGQREDFVCSDVNWFDRNEASVPGKIPLHMAIEPQRGCPFDCGLCSEHEQHTCIGLLEITSSCNLECPVCFASSGPGGEHLTFQQSCSAIDHLVAAEGRPEVLQISGGEPTIHPQFEEVLRYACDCPIDMVMINTNGVRIAKDPRLIELLHSVKHRLEVYLQFDGFDDHAYSALRGVSLLETKMAAIEQLSQAGIHTILVCTVQSGVNDNQLGEIVDFAAARPFITGVSFQPATYCGRHVLPEQLENRVTFPDVIQGVAQQSTGPWQVNDFSPLPCAHPNAHTMAYAYRSQGRVTPLAQFINISEHLDLLSGRITINREHAEGIIREYLSRGCCGTSGCCTPDSSDSQSTRRGVEAPETIVSSLTPYETVAAEPDLRASVSLHGLNEPAGTVAEEFFTRILQHDLDPEHIFRISTTSFMDAYNFDIRQLMKSCVHHILPSGHIIPFSAYNVLYRTGVVPLPPLAPETVLS